MPMINALLYRFLFNVLKFITISTWVFFISFLAGLVTSEAQWGISQWHISPRPLFKYLSSCMQKISVISVSGVKKMIKKYNFHWFSCIYADMHISDANSSQPNPKSYYLYLAMRLPSITICYRWKILRFAFVINRK